VLGEVGEACGSVSSFPGGGQLACGGRLSHQVEVMNRGLGVAGGKGLGGDASLDGELHFGGVFPRSGTSKEGVSSAGAQRLLGCGLWGLAVSHVALRWWWVKGRWRGDRGDRGMGGYATSVESVEGVAG
jgi:hypothetical protein